MSKDPADPQEREANPVGRPSSYKPEYAEQAEKLCRLGATLYDLADFFEVNVLTIHRWMSRFEEFCKAVKVGQAPADERVVRSLYERAVGYTYHSEKIFYNAKEGEVIRADVIEHVPPDPGAAMNWLKNRQRDKWSDTKTIDGHVSHTHLHETRDVARAVLELLEEAALEPHELLDVSPEPAE